MLTIRKEQMQAFEQVAMTRFEEEMVERCKEFSPGLCADIGDAQIGLAVRNAVEQSGGHGFTNRGPIRLFIEHMLLFGSSFDTDPQYPWISEILHAQDDQMLRADRLFEKILDYREKVAGPDPALTRRAIEGLSGWARKHEALSPTEFVSSMLQEMAHVCPPKAAYIGEEGLTELVLEGSADALRHGFSPVHGEALIGVLMYTFGHGFMGDPLYPWSGKILENTLLSDPAGRVGALEKEAMAFLDRMIAALQEGERK